MDANAVLNALLAVESRPSKALINLLFNLLVGEEFTSGKKLTIKSPVIISHILELLTSTTQSLSLALSQPTTTNEDATMIQDLIKAKFMQILYEAENLDVCCNNLKLPENLIELISRCKDIRLFQTLVDLLGVLGNHSFNGKQLKQYFDLLERRENSSSEDPRRPLCLMQTLQSMTTRQGPYSYFHFEGNNGGIMINNIDKWPSGYSFATWIKIETMQDSSSSIFLPRIFSFFNDDGAGIEAYFERSLTSGVSLSLKSKMNRNSVSSVSISNYDFQCMKWHFITITHAYKLLGRSDVNVYVNGHLIQTAQLKYPVIEKKSIVTGYIGANPNADHNASLFGQMGTIFFFKEAIGPAQVTKLYNLKPNLIIGPNEISEIGASLLFAFPPQTCFGQICFDANTGPNGEGVAQPIHGLKMQGVREVIAYHIKDSLHCALGIESIFPFISLALPRSRGRDDMKVSDFHQRSSIHSEWISAIASFLDHPSIQAEMEVEQSLELLGYIQQKLPPKVITSQTIFAFEGLITQLSSNDSLRDQSYLSLLFNFQMWIYSDFTTQTQFLLTLASHMQRDPQYFKKLFGVQQWLDVLRSYYWYKSEPDSLCVEQVIDKSTQEVIAQRPKNPEEIKELRGHITTMLQLMLKEEVNDDDIQAIANYLHDCNDHLQVEDMLKFLICLLSNSGSLSTGMMNRKQKTHHSPPKGLLRALKKAGGNMLFFPLLQREEESVRVLAIQLIHIYSKQTENIIKIQLGNLPLGIEFDDGFCLFANTLMMYPFTETIYKALLQACFDDPEIETPFIYENQKIYSPKIITTIFQLLSNGAPILRKMVLTDFNLICKLGPPETRDCIVQQLGWQSWLLNLFPSGMESVDIAIQNEIYNLFQTLFKHCFTKKDGWQVMDQLDAHLSMFVRPTDYFRKLEMNLYERILENWEEFTAWDNKDALENYAFFVVVFEDILYLPASGANFDDIVMQKDLKGAWVHWNIVQRVLNCCNSLMSCKAIEQINSYILRTKERSLYSTMMRLIVTSLSEAPTSIGCRSVHDKKAEYKKVYNNLKQAFDSKLSDPNRKTVPTNIDSFERNTFSAFEAFISDRLNQLDIETKELLKYMESAIRQLKFVLLKHIPPPSNPQQVLPSDQLNRIIWLLNCLIYITHNLQQCKLPVPDSLYILQRDIIKSYKPFIEKQINFSFPGNMDSLDDVTKIADYVTSIMSSQSIMLKLKTIRMTTDMDMKQCLLSSLEERRKKTASFKETLEKQMKNDVVKEVQLSSASAELRKKSCYNEVNRRAAIAMQFAEKQGRLSRLWKSKLRSFSNERTHLRTKNTEAIFWKLDKTEDKLRRRWKLKRNFEGSNHKEASIAYIKAQNKLLKAQSESDEPNNPEVSKLIGLSSLNQSMSLMSSGIYDSQLQAENEADSDIANEKSSEDPEWCVVQIDEMKATTFDSRLREEKLLCSVSCELVTAFKSLAGKLDITNQNVYFIASYDASSSRFDSLSRKWPLASFEKIMKRRYLLRDKAIEIFLSDRRNYFFNFPSKQERDSALKGIVRAKPPNLIYDGRSPAELLKKSKLTELWQQRAISNFEYLMHLNTIAGRTYNDLHQYPVFPWVLADYSSPKLDLSDESIYRDLSKPIGALNPVRLQQFKDRANSLEGTDIPPFLYGSHYSNAGNVLFYLIRQEPFTTQFLTLQGNRFDHADRLFNSIETTWSNCLQAQQDVKELIPEFFYSPDFLLNTNSLDLGVTQSGITLNDVELPKWADGSVHEFVRINREALESEYVSDHLHEWIDLIFGYKQRGQAAEEADNVFYYLTYEGAVDIDSITDPVIRQATEEQILNFGQCPTQLLDKPHPKRSKGAQLWQSVFQNPLNFQAYIYAQLSFTPHFVSLMDRLVVIGTDGEYITYNWNNTIAQPPSSNQQSIVLTVLDQCLVSPNKSVTTADFGHPTCFGMLSSSVALWGGFWDNSFRTKQLTAQQTLLQNLREHKGPVTCLTMNEDCTIVATGSKDATILIWKVVTRGLMKTAAIDDYPVHILRGHVAEVTAIAISTELDIAISGAVDGTILIHTLSGRFIRKVVNPYNAVVGYLSIAFDQGRFAMCTRGSNPYVIVYDLNGAIVKTVQEKDKGGITSLITSKDGKYLLTGGDRITVRNIHTLEIVHAYDIVCRVAPGSCLCLSKDGRNLFAALQNGDLLVFGYFLR